MNYLKKSVFFLCIISSFFTVSAHGVSTSTMIKKALIRNAYLATFLQEDNNLNISFNISNQVGDHPFIKYSFILFSEESNGKKNIVNEYSGEKIINTKSDNLVFKDVLYKVPPDLKGDFKLAIVLKNDSGSVFSVAEIGKVSLGNTGVEVVASRAVSTSNFTSKILSYVKDSFKFALLLVVILLMIIFFYRKRRSGINKNSASILLFIITSTFLFPTNAAHAYSFGILEGIIPPSCGYPICFPEYIGFEMGTVTFSLNKTSYQPGEIMQISSSIQSNVAGGYYQDFALQCGIYNNLAMTLPYGWNEPSAFVSPCTNDPGIPGSLTAVRYISGMPTNYVGGRGPINIVNALASPVAPITPGTYYLNFYGASGYPQSAGTYILPFTVVSTPPPTVNIWFSFLNKTKSFFSGMLPSKVFAEE